MFSYFYFLKIDLVIKLNDFSMLKVAYRKGQLEKDNVAPFFARSSDL